MALPLAAATLSSRVLRCPSLSLWRPERRIPRLGRQGEDCPPQSAELPLEFDVRACERSCSLDTWDPSVKMRDLDYLLLPGHQDFDGTLWIRPKPGDRGVPDSYVPVQKHRLEIEDKPMEM